MSLRIAQISATFPPYYAGSGNTCFYQSEALAARGHDVEVFTASYPGVLHNPRNVRVHRFTARFRLGNAPFVPQLARLHSFDVVHLHQPFIFGTEFVLLARERGRFPLVSSYHNELQADGLKGALFRGYDQVITRRAMRWSDRLTVLSMEHARAAPLLAEELRRRPHVFVPVPNGVDPRMFHPGEEPEVRARLGLSVDQVVGVLCAKLDAPHLTKRPDLAIAAVAQVPDVVLLIVGGGALQGRYELEARRAGVGDRVVFVGDVPHAEIARFMRASDFLVMPSTLEAFGIVQVEAMATGIPVVASRLPGAQGVLRDGIDGFHVPPGDVAGLVNGVRRMVGIGAARRTAMGAAGRQRVLANYTWEAGAAVLERVYVELLQSRRGHFAPRATSR